MFSGQEGILFDWLCITNRKPEFNTLSGPGGPQSPTGPRTPETQTPQEGSLAEKNTQTDAQSRDKQV